MIKLIYYKIMLNHILAFLFKLKKENINKSRIIIKQIIISLIMSTIIWN